MKVNSSPINFLNVPRNRVDSFAFDSFVHSDKFINESKENINKFQKWSNFNPMSEPVRQTSQWDALLKEMVWMHQDYHHERNWKKIVAKNIGNEGELFSYQLH